MYGKEEEKYSWIGQEPVVTIKCITYNQANYISDCLEGFLKQKTQYPFEIIIHDDASTDGTSDIIKEYQKRYPTIIKTIIQEKNLYSSDRKKFREVTDGIPTKEYVCECEGDDYWVDECKIEKQVSFLENNKEYVACFGNYYLLNMKNGKKIKRLSERSRDINIEDAITWSNNLNMHISTLMYRSNIERRMYPFVHPSCGDYPLAIYLTYAGKVYYMGEVLSCYRYMSSNESWSMKQKNIETKIKFFKDENTMLDNIDKYLDFKYAEVIAKRKRVNEYQCYRALGENKIVFFKYKDVWKQQSLETKIGVIMAAFFPKLYNKIRG